LLFSHFFCGYIIDRKNKTNKAFPSLLAKAAAVAAVPQALVMIYGAFNPAVITKVPGLRIAIAFGGLSLLWIALKAFSSDDDEKQAEPSKTKGRAGNPSTHL
jgi:uncharacterized membrane protein